MEGYRKKEIARESTDFEPQTGVFGNRCLEHPFYPGLEKFITSAPVVAICAEGPSAISVVRGMMGSTNGAEAPPGTIRGDYGISRQYNLMHGSDSPEAAEREIGLFFPGGEGILDWATADADWHTCD